MDKRLQLMTSGAEDLEQWMLDAIRQGFAALDKQNEEWDSIISRMIDAKSRGLALQLRIIATDRAEGWPERLLDVFSQLYLSTQGVQNFEKLNSELQEQLLQVIGVTVKQKELLEQKGIKDDWLVLSCWSGINLDQAAMQKTWLLSLENQQIALLLEYDYMGQGFKNNFKIGQIINGEIIYFPGTYPMRATLKDWKHSTKMESRLLPYSDFSTFLKAYSEALAENPWLKKFPCIIENTIPHTEAGKFYLLDKRQTVIEMKLVDIVGWTLLSISSTKPLTIFGEWDGERFHPLSVFMGKRFKDLGAMISDTTGAKRFGSFGR
ncbi:MAG: hypothetical protein AB8F74_08330 [Saprospiraceae bacterium]